MSLFKNLTTDGLEEARDSLGGAVILPTDSYPMTIKVAFAGVSQKGSQFIEMHLVTEDGREIRTRQYITSAKTGGNYSINESTKKKEPLPGFTLVDDVCLIVTGKPLAMQDSEEKTINLYDFDEKKEVPTVVPMLTELLGGVVVFSVEETISAVQKEDPDTKQYVNTYEDDGSIKTRKGNEVLKAFDPETLSSVVEARKGVSPPVFHDAWVSKYKGVVRNRVKDDKGPGAGGKAPGLPGIGGNAGAAKKSGSSLFKR